ncbi:hypothetical protein IFM46972_10789 [Aspergillus udagawae]|uniref:Uncharacterized protein n=1 Tax=Aspergillus udagawae TaxID=91492 RepID=A0A8H3SEH0_9EURO|nr:hypothetical protein IFM46972_10789 [Aspergillus udagawae]
MQVHSTCHFATCFKYRQMGSANSACRFGIPRDLIPASKVDEFGLIHLARNYARINPWNISLTPTVSKSLSLIYYITNYTMKGDVSPWQVVAKAALLKQSIEKATVSEPPTSTGLRLREKVASMLLQLRTYYTVNYNFIRINLWWLRYYVRAIVQPHKLDTHRSSDPMAEEACTYETGDTSPISVFDNYKWRGQHLAPLALFEYCMLVKTKNLRDAITDDVDFDPSHPRYVTHVQRLARTLSQVATVTLNGQLSEFRTAEDAVSRGHPQTTAIMND